MSDSLSAVASMTGPGTQSPRGRGLRRLIDAALLKGVGAALSNACRGQLHLTLPSGRRAVIGAGEGVQASLTLTSYAVIWKAMRRGLVGFGDAYVGGGIETDDLNAVFHFVLDNQAAISAGLPWMMRSARRDVADHAARRNTRRGSRQNIAAHYDLGNAFYRLWLDDDMSYSSGIYENPGQTLEQAQAEKHARIIAALDLDVDQTVLEIGCGWGALAEAMLTNVARIDAITISDQQLRATRDRLGGAIADGRVSARFEDYRDTIGSFDRIVSIEMIEAVGEDNWPTYFSTINERLKPGGAAIVQAITIRADLYEDYRRNPDFIQCYIFPGGMLPTVGKMRDQAKAAGLEFAEVERFGASYAITVAEWRRRFIKAWPRIQALGFDERFRRMWIYYLTYCEAGFQHGTIDVGLYRLTKP